VAVSGNIVSITQTLIPKTISNEVKGGGLTLQIGDTADDYNKVTVSVDDLSSKGLKIDKLDVSSQEAAAASIQTIRNAINQVSTNRADLGALQNRLEYTINNLDVMAENMSAANSRIRDTDMAKEMMNYTKMSILTQAAQSMLAQANMQPQSILQLLG
jgi:flagellin